MHCSQCGASRMLILPFYLTFLQSKLIKSESNQYLSHCSKEKANANEPLDKRIHIDNESTCLRNEDTLVQAAYANTFSSLHEI